jgi:Ca2+-binding EF-hand superfamily protein
LKYDVDNNGTLDKDEFTEFILFCKDILGADDALLQLNMENKLQSVDFNSLFDEFDTDISGNFNKVEMFNLLD